MRGRYLPVHVFRLAGLVSPASRDRIVVSTLRCGRSNPGSNPGHGNGDLFARGSTEPSGTRTLSDSHLGLHTHQLTLVYIGRPFHSTTLERGI